MAICQPYANLPIIIIFVSSYCVEPQNSITHRYVQFLIIHKLYAVSTAPAAGVVSRGHTIYAPAAYRCPGTSISGWRVYGLATRDYSRSSFSAATVPVLNPLLLI